jgi:assimilatory nitrate reductase catalytic subunit
MAWHGLLLRRDHAQLASPDYWCRIAIGGGFAYTLAGVDKLAPDQETPDAARILAWLGPQGSGVRESGEGEPGAAGAQDLAVYADPACGVFRYAHFADGRLETCLFIARDPASLPDRASAVMMFGEAPPDHNRVRVLAGASLAGVASPGPTVCACFAVGRNTIVDAIQSGNFGAVGEISAALRAGTNCGSCLPELAVILSETRAEGSAPGVEEPALAEG